MKLNSLCVFCSSSNAVDNSFFDAAKKIGKEIAQRRMTLIYGGSKVGLMGTLSDSVNEGGGKVVGVIPQSIFDKGISAEGLEELIVTEDLRSRKAKMESLSDGFLVLPGGLGTLEEAFEIITLRQLNQHQKPVIFLQSVMKSTRG